jgi:hypothetical protein
MPRVVHWLLIAITILALLFAFTPISRALLRSVDGSFAPTPYSSLALITPSLAAVGIKAGKPIPVQLTNETGNTKTYHWSATQDGTLVSLGEKIVPGGQKSTILVPSQGAVAGTMRISLSGSAVFVTVPILGAQP